MQTLWSCLFKVKLKHSHHKQVHLAPKQNCQRQKKHSNPNVILVCLSGLPMVLAHTPNFIEIIDVGEEANLYLYTNLLGNAKVFGQHPFLGQKCYK
jgi:hypothetical protein